MKKTKSSKNKKIVLVPHWGVRVNYSSYSTVTRESDPDEAYDADDISNDFNVQSIEPDSENFTLVVPFDLVEGETYYLVTVRYGTGDSFHHEDGCHEMIDLFRTKNTAEACALAIKNHYEIAKHGGKNSSDIPIPKSWDAYSLTYQDDLGHKKTVHASWTGYFEGLEDVQIDTLIYQPNFKNKPKY